MQKLFAYAAVYAIGALGSGVAALFSDSKSAWTLGFLVAILAVGIPLTIWRDLND